MTKIMATVSGSRPELTLEQLMKELKLSEAEVDMEYGAQNIPTTCDYVIQVEEAAAKRIGVEQGTYAGPYADVEIETFGPEGSQQDS